MKGEFKREKEELDLCLVCGLRYKNFFPWGEDGECPSYGFCDCCGVEFGYGDFYPESREELRKKWIEDGAKWDDLEKKPKNWDMKKQLSNLKNV